MLREQHQPFSDIFRRVGERHDEYIIEREESDQADQAKRDDVDGAERAVS